MAMLSLDSNTTHRLSAAMSTLPISLFSVQYALKALALRGTSS